MRGRGAGWSFAVLLVLAPAPAPAQRAAPAGVHRALRPAHAAPSFARPSLGPAAAATRPRARTFVLAGAALGAVAGAALLGPRIYEATVGPALAYGLPAAAGAVVGAAAGYLVFRIDRGSQPRAAGPDWWR